MQPDEMALNFAERVNDISSIDELQSEIGRVSNSFGMTSFLSGALPSPGEQAREYVLLNGWPEDWFSRYMGRGYIDSDPVILNLYSTINPFTWKMAGRNLSPNSKAVQICNEAATYGLNDGFAIPIYSRGGQHSGVSFGTDRLDMTDRERAALHLVGIYAHNRSRELLTGSGNKAVEKIMRLSKRELECLRWIAAGKTSWEIGEILTLSSRTVEHYIASACRKLDTVTRAQAVAVAVRAHVI